MPTGPRRAPNLPPVAEAAWHGYLGDVVAAVAPCTEADPIAILATSIALFGSIAGDTAHVRVGGARHPARIWPLIVGKTGAGRKGTSFAEARRLAEDWSSYADSYIHHRVVSGLSSGEGLLAALGAGADQADPAKEPIAPDGKLTVVEPEFARVLAATKRDGSTLGPILRQLWDDSSAAILTRAAPLHVEGAHLGLIAHVTPRELKLRLQESDVAGGTVNRFLLIASERPQLLPHEPKHPDLYDLNQSLGKYLDRARNVTAGEMHRDRACDKLWTDVYGALSEDEPDGTLGSVLARGPAYTMRLALVYALADGAGQIASDHLLAGLAVWQYAAATARLLFRGASEANDIDRLCGFIAAAAGGRTRTEIYHFFGRHKRSEDIDPLLAELQRTGEVTLTTDAGTQGRPSRTYRWTGKPRDSTSRLLTQYIPS